MAPFLFKFNTPEKLRCFQAHRKSLTVQTAEVHSSSVYSQVMLQSSAYTVVWLLVLWTGTDDVEKVIPSHIFLW